jgi:predicted transcriptional regulator
MPRSKLHKYLNILEVLVSEPMKLEEISYETSIECRISEKLLKSLIRYKLVTELSYDERSSFSITDRGLAVLKTLRAERYFQKIMGILPASQGETMSSLTRPAKEKKKE